MEPIYSDHSRVDERSLAMHRLVAAKLRANPAILDEARQSAALVEDGRQPDAGAVRVGEHLERAG